MIPTNLRAPISLPEILAITYIHYTNICTRKIFVQKFFFFLEILERKKGIADAIPDGSLSLLEGRTNVPACDARKVDVKR